MTLEQAFADLQVAMADYGIARKSLAHHRGLAKHGLANGLMHAVAAEHSAFHRLERAQAAYEKLLPATLSPKPVAATPAKIAPPVAAKSNATAAATTTSAFDLLGHLNDRCEASEARWMARYGLKPERNS